jgi:hypothetical protein
MHGFDTSTMPLPQIASLASFIKCLIINTFEYRQQLYQIRIMIFEFLVNEAFEHPFRASSRLLGGGLNDATSIFRVHHD